MTTVTKRFGGGFTASPVRPLDAGRSPPSAILVPRAMAPDVENLSSSSTRLACW
jgi:hypothetical protein